MTCKPVVSVIIPAWNAEVFVAQTINSVLAQTYPSVEILVGDDASTDGTRRVLESFGDCIRIFGSDRNGGNGQLRNRLVTEARGKYVAFLDHDDQWHPEKLQQQVEAMEANPRASLCHTASELFGDATGSGPVADEVRRNLHGRCFDKLIYRNGILISTMMVRRELLPTPAFWADLPGVRDYGLCLRLLFDHEAIYLPQFLTRYRRHDTQITAKGERYLQINAGACRLRILDEFHDGIEPRLFQQGKDAALEELSRCAYSFYWRGEFDLAERGFALLRANDHAVPLRHRARAALTNRWRSWTQRKAV